MSSKPHMHKQWLTIKVLELYSEGNSYRQIADIMQVTVHRARSVAESVAASLALTDSILRKSMELSEKEKDPRVILQALELAHEMNLVKNQLLVDSQRIANAIKRQSLKLREAS